MVLLCVSTHLSQSQTKIHVEYCGMCGSGGQGFLLFSDHHRYEPRFRRLKAELLEAYPALEIDGESGRQSRFEVCPGQRHIVGLSRTQITIF